MISVLPLAAVLRVAVVGFVGLSTHASPPSEPRLETRANASARGAMTESQKPKSESGVGRAKKVPGGWKLPGDDTLYPYDPGLPPDLVNPRPPRKDRPGVSKQER